MPFSTLPARLADWPALFPASGLLRLGAQGAEPLASLPEHTGILVLMGRPLVLSELAPLAARLDQAPVALPPFNVAGVEVLVRITSYNVCYTKLLRSMSISSRPGSARSGSART